MKMTYTKSRPETIFQLLTFTFDPFFNVKWGYLTIQRPYVSFSAPLLLILRREITTAAVALLLVLWLQIVKTDHQKSRPSNDLPEKNFGLI